MRAAIAEFIASDGLAYAECGDFMYLTEAIVDREGRSWPMAGVFPTKARMQTRLAKLSYISISFRARASRNDLSSTARNGAQEF
jgi:cobyrinic acid a,c-diamide synthase